ncbi:MAG TPA: M15 family metallopeptidase [Chitinophagaceae bacterium]|nr:M15 family metallopeptidase [Chitinophagaceae bacterium]
MINKITKGFHFRACLFCIFSTFIVEAAYSQQTNSLQVIHTIQQYNFSVKDDRNKEMVELKSLIPELVYDLRYATKNNFTGVRLYSQGTKTFMRAEAAKALAQVDRELAAKGFGLKIFDAYRPYSVTVKMWHLIKDERYVADPSKGSGHNRGIAVDLTIINRTSGEELPMGTGFDNFSDTAHQNFTSLPAEILQNRLLLKSVMEKHGFKALETEWWHYYYTSQRNFDVLDIDFKKFRQH